MLEVKKKNMLVVYEPQASAFTSFTGPQKYIIFF